MLVWSFLEEISLELNELVGFNRWDMMIWEKRDKMKDKDWKLGNFIFLAKSE